MEQETADDTMDGIEENGNGINGHSNGIKTE